MIIKSSLLAILKFSLFFLFSGLVIAQEDFSATSVPSVELCPCSNQAYTVTVQNTGTTESIYRVLANNELSDWITFNPSRFVLSPGQKGSFSVVVNSACNIKDSFDLEIFVATDTGLVKVLNQELQFLDCYDHSLELGNVVDISKEIEFIGHGNSYNLCKNEQKAIPILITNNENFDNIYKLNIDAPRWAVLNADEVQLGPGKSGILLINYDTIDVEGRFNIKLDAISRLGEVQRKKRIDVSVSDCYSLSIDIDEDPGVVCGGEEKTYDVAVENTGTIGRNVIIDVEGPEWVSLNNGSFYLRTGSEKVLKLRARPGNDISGNFLAEVFSVSDNESSLKLSDGIDISVVSSKACYGIKIDLKAVINNFYSKEFISARIENNGIRSANYSLNIDGPSWIEVRPRSLQLDPGKIWNANIEVNPDQGVEEGVFDSKLNLESNGQVYSSAFKINVKGENDFVKKAKAAFRLYRYYIYVLLVVLVLIFLFNKPIRKFVIKSRKRYEKYKEKRERRAAARSERKARESQKSKQEKQKEAKKSEKREISKKVKKKTPTKSNTVRILIYILIIVAALIFIGHQNRLFNAKYLHVYISNFFVSYLYYILIGVGGIVVLSLAFLLYTFFVRKGRKSSMKEIKAAEMRSKGKTKHRKIPYFKILVWIIIAALLVVANFPDIEFGVLGDAKDFLILYQFYFLSGIGILVAIIFLIRFYNPLFKFLRE
jgi:hypothetical protein